MSAQWRWQSVRWLGIPLIRDSIAGLQRPWASLAERRKARIALNNAVAAASPTADFAVRYPAVRPEDHEHMLDGLRKAGWQG